MARKAHRISPEKAAGAERGGDGREHVAHGALVQAHLGVLQHNVGGEMRLAMRCATRDDEPTKRKRKKEVT